MRVRLQGWSRTITLVPWHEAGGRLGHRGAPLELAELRRLIIEEPGVAASLRSMLRELDEPTHERDAREGLAEAVLDQIDRGRLRVGSQPYLPMSSDAVELLYAPEWEPTSTEIYEDEHHWVEVELLDESGQPVVGERCRIVLPDGREVFDRSDQHGLVRVEGSVEGQCTISFPNIDAGALGPLTQVGRQGAQTLASKPRSKPMHWVEVELLGEDGVGIVGERCEITLPDGAVVTRKTDGRGLIRLARLTAAGDCEIRFPDMDAGAMASLGSVERAGVQGAPVLALPEPPRHWVEVELLGEDGVGIAGERCEITLPDGAVVTRKTDGRGLIRLASLASPGDCRFSFPELDATTWGGEVPVMVGGQDAGGGQVVGHSDSSKAASAHWLEVLLVDEAGVGVAAVVCEITLPDGELLRRKTDAGGVIRLPRVAAAGDCQISFVEFDAGAWAAAQ